MATFDLLHPNVQRAIHELKWERFKPIQDESINHLLLTPSDVIISAPTASGKTEAAFLPIISKIADNGKDSVKVLYISPLKALINDQFNRVTELCKKIDFPITKWHGDASATQKAKLIKNPSGILLITPESIEALFINKSSYMGNMFKNLEYIVIDEIHSFIENERGTHLRSLIRRLESSLEIKPVTVALSATINNLEGVREWLNPEKPESVKLIKDLDDSKSIRGIIKGFINTNKNIDDTEEDNKSLNEENTSEDLIKTELFELIKKDKNLIFANSKAVLEDYCDSMQEIARQNAYPNRFFIHHGSLSKNIRESAEHNLKNDNNISVFCTNTLELGIDIGSITRVVLLAPPHSVASMIQRLGRSGRKENEAKEFQFFIEEDAITDKSKWHTKFRMDLVQSIAIVELMLEKWCEPLATNIFDYSTFVHQILSYLGQTGGATAIDMYKKIGQIAFNNYFSQDDFIDILKSLKENEIIYQNQSNLITLDKKGERIVENYEFYAAFQTPSEWKVIYNGKEIGQIDSLNLLSIEEGSHILLAGKRWEVIEIKPKSEVILVKKAIGKKPIRFNMDFGNIHKIVHQKMLEIYEKKPIPRYIHKSAIPILEEAFEQYELYVKSEDSLILPVLEGTKTQKTVALLLKNLRIQTDFAGIGFYAAEGRDYLKEKLKKINFDSLNPIDLVCDEPQEFKLQKKFDSFLSEEILNKSYINLALDIQNTKEFCQNL